MCFSTEWRGDKSGYRVVRRGLEKMLIVDTRLDFIEVIKFREFKRLLLEVIGGKIVDPQGTLFPQSYVVAGDIDCTLGDIWKEIF